MRQPLLHAARPPCSGHPGQSPVGWTTPRSSRFQWAKHGPSHGPRREYKGKECAACARRMGDAPPWVGSWFQPIAHPYGPPTDLLRAILNHLDSSHSPMSSPLTEAMHEMIKNMVKLHESCMDLEQ
ncbi:phosphatidylserine synthase 2-like [Dorcoceras hygrometricum]|uniref:Phosphatidylserine synthase 2-like n=1 Tax=Dorcoceras hygrometricum TaxID=472368 RepID=A0A2Z7D422_9LAMI|nr:phosphatidylserine synthase 2-like [Dorcoceras hygrometricum]